MVLNNTNEILEIAIKAALQAGHEVLNIYNNKDFNIEYKDDSSPLTIADKTAHNIINTELLKTNIPILSEEGIHLDYSERKQWEYLCIVDPLDGTKEFIKRNGEFTINIALVYKQKPILGVIYCPVSKTLYFNYINGDAFLVNNVATFNNDFNITKEIYGKQEKLPLNYNNSYKLVASRSHISDKTKEFIDEIKKEYSNIEVVNIGSSLKLCLLATGEANIYPRFTPTMEWDIAAGHAILKASGGNVINNETNKELIYNKADLHNSWFIAKSKN